MVLQSRRDFDLFLKVLAYIAAVAHFMNVCNGGELSESESFFNFIRTVDPKNILRIDWQWVGATSLLISVEGCRDWTSPRIILPALPNISNRNPGFLTSIPWDQVQWTAESSTSASSPLPDSPPSHAFKNWITCLPLVVGIAFFLLFTLFVNMKTSKLAKDKMILRALAHSPPKTPPPNVEEVLKPEQKLSELVFFVEEEERFGLEDLLEAAADLQNQGFCSSLYKVKLKNNDAIFAVKRLKKLQVTSEEFGQTMQKIGNLKHQNILPPVGYNSCNEEMLLIYRYQGNGSLLTLLENYTESKRDFPWKLRLSIAIGIARGLDFIYQSSDDWEIIPHGNIKPSNILLNENEEPLISDYGYSKFLDPKRVFNSNGYTAPERSLSEQADVFSFGVILLELLTGKIVQKSGLDLPKWVKSIVREEWTGEVFDKEVAKVGQWAFPLLNISLKCVAHFPENRPTFAEVLEKIEEVVNGQEDLSPSSETSSEAN
ncbi:hypothetical protein F0562_010007 [Nyssa sinensis]|uniref:Protein kinase domain-containing protein n=1 Tax=Nyssa sinensis TaxID=561372 RepID=A0A5J5A0A3_9ASTE|nr:hypothetical protein F0562_010007 [Nyssa sinensis]